MDGNYLSKSLGRLKGDLSRPLPAPGQPKGVKTFHSFRHTVASKLATLGCPENLAALILGHKHRAMTYGRYGNKVEVEVLRPWLERVGYEGD